MGIGKEFIELMDKINYTFSDITYLQTALTHTSYTNEMKGKGFRAPSNETLEFLGDAVLETVVSEELYDRYEKLGEGVLTKMRQTLVCESTLAVVARSISLGDYLNIGNGEENTGVREKTKVLADAMEALIAAIYIDDRAKGGNEYKNVIVDLFYDEIEAVSRRGNGDYKTRLQQFVEKNGDSSLHYEYTETGPQHEKLFCAVAYINNNRVGEGTGSTKRAAEMQAARAALRLFGIL